MLLACTENSVINPPYPEPTRLKLVVTGTRQYYYLGEEKDYSPFFGSWFSPKFPRKQPPKEKKSGGRAC